MNLVRIKKLIDSKPYDQQLLMRNMGQNMLDSVVLESEIEWRNFECCVVDEFFAQGWCTVSDKKYIKRESDILVGGENV